MSKWVSVRLFVLGLVFAVCISGAASAQIASNSAAQSPWVSQDIGSSTLGGESVLSTDQFTLSAGGAFMSDATDQFHFVYQPLSGDVRITARLDSLMPAHVWSQAGLIIRSSLQPDAAQMSILATGDGGSSLRSRTQTGLLATSLAAQPPAGAPRWLGLERLGSRVTAYSSADGATWTAIGSDSIELGADVYVGIAVTGYDAGQRAVAGMSQVSVGGLPAGMRHGDIGDPAGRGNAWHTQGTYTISTGGAAASDTRDQFHFVYREMQGDMDVVARVASLTDVNGRAKAGVMIRESLTADSRHAAVLVTSENGYVFDWRAETGGVTEHTAGGPGGAPGWVRLVRRGTNFEAFRSNDGLAWTAMGSGQIAAGQQAYVGVAATSESTEAMATLDAVSLASTVDARASITVDPPSLLNLPPVVSLASPLTGSTFTAPATITMTALATDPELRMARVEFYANSTLVGTRAASPYSFTWSSVPAGSYTLTAVAFDLDGGQAASTPVAVTVQAGPNQPPAVALTSPANGATFREPATITLTAAASDPENRLARVEFFRNGTLLGTDSSSPYSFTWSSVPAGSYTLTARAFDADGGQTTSAAASVTVQGPNQAPAVTLTAPANGATFSAPATITLTAAASDPENRLARVEFYRNGMPIGTDTSSPYSFTWTSVPTGSYTLTAVAFDADGGQRTSAAVSITVNPNQSPSVALTSPANGATFTAPASIGLTASASDPENRLARVEFYGNGTLLGTDTSSPYSFTWSSVPAGSYTLTARVFDSDSGQATSSAITITVNAAQPSPPRVVVFTASTDHDSNVASYLLEVFASGADPQTASSIASSDLGKPTPDANRDITADRSAFFYALAPGNYIATVKAIGPGGSTRGTAVAFSR
jgi:regulation of enolase protein 1 (concanavalin A-like superfamily)